MRKFLLAAAAAGAIAAVSAPAGAAVLDDFNRADTASGLGPNWTTITAGASIQGNLATGGIRALYTWAGGGDYASNNVEFDFQTASTPTAGTYTARALLNWDGTSGYIFAVQHQGASFTGYNKYSIGYVTTNALTHQLDYSNVKFADIGATLSSGHLSASVVGNVATLVLTSGSSTYTFGATYAAAQTYTGSGIGIGFVDGSKIDNFGSTAAAVPEPATWAMMIGGFGMVGGAMRSRRKATLASA